MAIYCYSVSLTQMRWHVLVLKLFEPNPLVILLKCTDFNHIYPVDCAKCLIVVTPEMNNKDKFF